MAKRIITQRRGRGTSTYKVRRQAFKHKIQFPKVLQREGEVLRLFNSSGHTAPLAKVNSSSGSFYIPAFEKMFEGQKIEFEGDEFKNGSIMKVGKMPIKTKIYCIESKPGDGGKFIKSGGSSAIVNRIVGEEIFILMPSKKEKKFNKNCRAIVGEIAGHGRLEKPILKAGRKHHLMKAKSKLWPRTSPIKMNAIDHPFGSGRGKNPKSKIAKRNSPPGAKVGLLRPRRTGKRK